MFTFGLSLRVLQIVQVKKRAYDNFFNENIINRSPINKTMIYKLAQFIIYHFVTAYNGCLHFTAA